MPLYKNSGTAATTSFDDTAISTATSGAVTGDDVQEIFDNQLGYLAVVFTSIFTTIGSLPAVGISFDNSSNGFAASNVQTAIEEAATSGGAVTSVNSQTGVVVLDQDDVGDGTTYKQYSATEKTKLAGIETGADVTDATNVDAAGAVMKTGSTMTGDLTISKASPSLIMDRTNPAGTGIIEFQNSGTNAWRYGIYTGGSDNFMIHYTGTGANHALEIDTSNILTITNLKIRTTIDANSHVISNVTDPSTAQQAATKNYVDTKSPRQLFDHYADAGNVGTGEDDLYSDSISAIKLSANGEKYEAYYQVVLTGDAASTQQVRVYFGGTAIYDSGALNIGVATNYATIRVDVIRVSSSVVRCAVSVSSDFATLFPYSKYTEVTGLTLSSSQILKITGEAVGAGAADNQIVAKQGNIHWMPAA